jgi:hypothetical protein
MSKTLPCAGTVYNWVGDTLGGPQLFDFFAGGPARSWQIFDTINSGAFGVDNGFGEWTIAAVGPNEPPPPGTVPEPPMISLVLAAMLLVGRAVRRRPLRLRPPLRGQRAQVAVPLAQLLERRLALSGAGAVVGRTLPPGTGSYTAV